MRVRTLFPSSRGNDPARRSEIAVKHPHGQNGFLCGEIRKKKGRHRSSFFRAREQRESSINYNDLSRRPHIGAVHRDAHIDVGRVCAETRA